MGGDGRRTRENRAEQWREQCHTHRQRQTSSVTFSRVSLEEQQCDMVGTRNAIR